MLRACLHAVDMFGVCVKYACCMHVVIGRHQKRYSIIAITLHYDFALSHNAFILFKIVIASYSYRFDVIDKSYCIYLLLLLGKLAFQSKYNMILVYFS